MEKQLSNIFITVARPDDYAACKRLTNQSENRKGLGFFSRVVFNDTIQQHTRDPRHILLIAKNDNDKILGFVRALRLKNNTQTTIHEICRDINAKGCGIGQALLSAVEKDAIAHQIPKLRLKMPFNTETAGRAYERFGFKHTATEYPADHNNLKRRLKVYTKELSLIPHNT